MPNTYTDRAVESLIINKMTQAQYDALPEKSDTELYLIDGGESSMFAEQMIVMPEASEAYLNRIVQFIGNSTMTYITGYFYRCVFQGGTYVWKKINVQANQGGGGSGQEIQFDDLPEATDENVGQILQYVGETIPDVCEKGYFYINQPEWSDPSATISQTAGQIDSISFETTVGNIEITNDTPDPIRNLAGGYGWTFSSGTFTISRVGENTWDIGGEDQTHGSIQGQWGDDAFYGLGFIVSGEPQIGDTVVCTYTLGNMYDLSVNVDTFIEAEQPTQSENVAFVASVIADDMALGTQVGTFVCDLNSAEFLARLVASWGNEWWNVLDTKNPYFVYTNSGWALSSQDGPTTIADPDNCVKAYSVANTDWGFYVTDDSTVQVGDYTSVIYTEGGTSWSKSGTTVDLVEYGISYSGAPVDGDTLTVSYSAPAIIGYAWNQINVQPASEGGSGIVWKTKMDIPTGITEWIYPQYNFGIVPDGKYELYTQMKVSTGEVIGCVTYKWFIELTSNNGQRNYKANLAYVLDGNYSSDGNYTLQEYTPHVSELVWTNNSGELILGSTEWTSWATDLPGYYPNYSAEDGIGAFKASSLKNIYTGEEYVGTGKYFVGSQDTTGLIRIDGNFYTTRFIGFPTQSRFGTTFNLGNDYEYFRISPASVPYENRPYPNVDYVHISFISDNGDYFDAKINFSYSKYKLEIIEATGMFTNVQFGYDSNSWEHNLYLKKPIGIGASGFAAVGGGNSEQTYVSVYSQNIDEFIPIEALYIGSPVTKDNFGTILQYTGDTDANYTNGYFYKATGTEVQIPNSFIIEQIEGETTNIVCNDVDAFITYLARYTGWDEDNIKAQWNNDSNYQRFMYAPNNIDGEKVSWNIYGWLPNDAIDYFTFTPSPSGVVRWDAVLLPSHKEIQNGHWEQVNVQPGDANNTVPDVTTTTNTVWSGDPGNAEVISFSTEKRHPEVGDYLCNDNGSPIQGIIMKYGDLMVPYTGWLQIASYDENSDTATMTAGGILVRNVVDLSPFTINYEDV